MGNFDDSIKLLTKKCRELDSRIDNYTDFNTILKKEIYSINKIITDCILAKSIKKANWIWSVFSYKTPETQSISEVYFNDTVSLENQKVITNLNEWFEKHKKTTNSNYNSWRDTLTNVTINPKNKIVKLKSSDLKSFFKISSSENISADNIDAQYNSYIISENKFSKFIKDNELNLTDENAAKLKPLFWAYYKSSLLFSNEIFFYFFAPSHYSSETDYRGIYFLVVDKKLSKNVLELISIISIFGSNYFLLIDTKHHSRQSIFNARKAANIAILVDSFSHNVSAHSLTALSSYFADRKKILEDRKNLSYSEKLKKEFIYVFQAVKSEYQKFIGNEFPGKEAYSISFVDIIRFGDKDLNKLIRFYEDSCNKHLPIPIDDSIFSYINYLSEKSEFWSAAIAGEAFHNSITNVYELLWSFVNNPLFIGTLASEKSSKIKFLVDGKDFAIVDLSIINSPNNKDSRQYDFVRLGENYKKVKDILSRKRVLLYGSNAGKQAVYTILENCLRNLKHYDLNNDKEIQFCIDVNETVDKTKFNFTVYLKHNTVDGVASSIEKITEKIKLGTYDHEVNQPILGGISQSILCADFLVTGQFYNKENPESFKVLKDDAKFVKYGFSLWKGKDVKIISNETNVSGENISRYKILVVKDIKNLPNIREKAKEAVRILHIKKGEKVKVYKEWLAFWLPNYKLDNNNICINLYGGTGSLEMELDSKNIGFEHGPESVDKLYYRNHGVYNTNIHSKKEKLKFEVAEAILSGIYIIDKRIYHLFREKKNILTIEEELSLFVKEESSNSLSYGNIINLIYEGYFISEDINFLVIHLSFIESLNNEYKKDITGFIDKIKSAIKDRENFHLIITTGRGRTVKFSDKYKYFVKLRSIYSLQNALLAGLMKGDDFEIKYNCAKVLFGS